MTPEEFMQYDLNCNYLNLNNQSSYLMNIPCINKSNNSNESNNSNLSNQSNNLIEGFVTDSGPGEKYIPPGECPASFSYCSKSGMCKQVCRNCYINMDIKKFQDVCDSNLNCIDNQNLLLNSNKIEEINLLSNTPNIILSTIDFI